MLALFDDVFSPYARKVRLALFEKDVPFERIRALHGDCDRTDFLHVNPRAEVPALLDGDCALYDSTSGPPWCATTRMCWKRSRGSNEREPPGSTPIACNGEAIASSG